eukprot:332934_1
MGICAGNFRTESVSRNTVDGKADRDDIMTKMEMLKRMRRSSLGVDLSNVFLNTIDRNITSNGTITTEQFEDCIGYWRLLRIYTNLAAAANTNNRYSEEADVKIPASTFKNAVALSQENRGTRVVLRRGSFITDDIRYSSDHLLVFFMRKLNADKHGQISLKDIQNTYQLAKSWAVFTSIGTNNTGRVTIGNCLEYFRNKMDMTNAVQSTFEDVEMDSSQSLDFDAFHERFADKVFQRQKQLLENTSHST